MSLIYVERARDNLENNYDIDPVTGCWNWNRGFSGSGYGLIYADIVNVVAHRHYYQVLVGPIPKGMVVHHVCGNKTCVNPEHPPA